MCKQPGELPINLDNALDIDGLYVHVPFCAHKCHYCDFYSITRQAPERMERFVELALREAELWSPGGNGAARPTTVFFGGGTPTLLPVELMRRLLCGLRDRFHLSGVGEWTVEANPATVTAEYAAMLREEGVDRLSFGAQSFDVAELATLQRHHHPPDVPRSIEIARGAGFRRLNVDLIYAIPGQSLDSWAKTLAGAIALGVEHISCYALTYEPNTAMAVKKRLGQVQAVGEDEELAMMRHARLALRGAGYEPYEISNYARAGEECRHNLMYWNGGSYIGLGPSAASHVAGRRWKNKPHLGEWEQAVGAGTVPAMDVEELSPIARAGELAMLQLRLGRGVDYADFAARSGYDARALYGGIIERLGKVGLLTADPRGFRLTEPGIAVADAVASEFLM